jgi:hypothetical protein
LDRPKFRIMVYPADSRFVDHLFCLIPCGIGADGYVGFARLN